MRWHELRRPIFVAAIAGAVLALAVLPARSTGPKAAAKAEAPARTAETPLDLNTASVSDLETVPGIGKSLADRIVAFRDKNGPFERVDDLIKVQGIGEKSLDKLRPYLTASRARAK